jgi:hypothetical protein
MTLVRSTTLALATLVLSSPPLQSQLRYNGQTSRPLALVAARAQTPEANSGGAFFLEALGGSIGSVAGIGAVILAKDCGDDDLGCEILTVGTAGIVGAIGATVGTTIAARMTGSRRSVLGAGLGAIVGTGVGLGVHYLVNNSSDRNLDDGAVVLTIFSMSQGTVAALGSRLIGAARSMR